MQIRYLRVVGLMEGFSFLVLLLVAMPLKYYFDFPLAVKWVGWTHGVLFIAYFLAVFLSINLMKWKLLDVAIALIASLLPLGTLVLDRSWRKIERESTLG